MAEEREIKMKSVMSTYIRRIIVVALATCVMGSTGWGQEIEPAVISFVIGGVTLQEDVKNPPVPSGMQKFEITYNTPITREEEEEKFRYRIAGLQIHSYPFEFVMAFFNAKQGTSLAVSEDRLTLTGIVDLPAGATYQNRRPNMIVDASQALIVNIQKSIQDIVPIFLSGNFDDFLNFMIPFSDLMKGDIISVYGTSISETEMQAILVIRHRKRSDFNGDGNVDFTDFLFFAGAFGTRDIFPGYVAEADLDGDGQVDFPDFLIFVSDFEG